MLTLSQTESSRISRISGLCPGTPEYLEILNDATRELMKRGNFWGTVKRFTACAYNNCLTYPRYVGTVLATHSCGHSIPPKNYWYEFNDVLPDDVRKWHGNNFQFGPTNCGFALADMGTTSVFNQVPCLNPRYIRFMPTTQTDVGKTITLFGRDGNQAVIRSTYPDGTVQDGIILTLAIPYVQTPFPVSSVFRVIKDPTDGPLYGYQFDGANLFNLATYEPTETLPEYRTDRLITGGCCHTSGNCGCQPKQYTSLIKLQFVPVQNPNDLVLIGNLDALALAMQSIKTSDSYDSATAEILMARAVRNLNLELRDKLPLDQTPARVHYQGTAQLWKRGIGFIT